MKKSPLYIALFLVSAASSAAEWDYPIDNTVVTTQQEAKAYLEQAYPEVGKFRFRYETQSKLGHHYNFDVLIEGEYQQQKSVVLSTNIDEQVSRVFRSLENTVLLNGIPTTAAELEVPRLLEAERAPSLSSGQVVSTHVNVFSPDLRTMDKAAPPESLLTDVSQYPSLPHYVQTDVEVLNHSDGIYLTNDRVSQVDAAALYSIDTDSGAVTNRDASNFLAAEGVAKFTDLAELQNVDWQDTRFPQLMVFAHLDQSLRYISNLGFDLFEEPLEFDGRGLSADNSTYYYGPKAALFGIGGGSPDALDGDVILHELGHGIHYHIVKDWAYGHTGAIGEGFGDYWAGSFSFRTQYENTQTRGQEFEIDTVFNWDGYFGVRNTTRSLWNQRARYFRQAEYRPHESVAGELGDELWSTPLFQALKASVEQYGELAFKEFDSIVLESMYGVGRGLKMHDLAESTLFVAQKLYPNRDYAEILKQKFDVHGLVIEPFKVEVASRYVDPEKALAIELYPTLRQAQVDGQVKISTLTQPFVSDPVNQLLIEAKLPTGEVCGSSVIMNTSVDYQYSDALKSQNWQHNLSLVYGLPVLESDIKEMNGYLPDSRLSSTNQPIVGFKTFNYTLNGAVQTADENFGVYLEIDHPRLSDLVVTLISPRGTRIDLLNHKSTRFSGFDGYFTLKHDSILDSFKGESINGSWRLEVADYVNGETGHLKRWGLGTISKYECGETTTSPKEPVVASGSSGGSASPMLILFMSLLSFGRSFTTRYLSLVARLFKNKTRR
ncbi:proprotein convertase P-domain-containing protein [Vibrio sp. 1CM2L]|uniref:proprotein convertase P-domain-containing protein n=1 Tax=Vibrio TaxID=662 RepID=UPI000EFC580E|nr:MULTISPECIES: proprotein convertase P-domain-containing protein [Vibrio]MCK8074934.1 proprotein convertase P-domain-containing protein [Vibrio sp. 1CM2L]